MGTEITVRTMDPQEIEIGDRIRVDTEDDSNVLTPGTFITHTVDRIYYETTTTESDTVPTQIGAIAKFTLNEIVSVELGRTGNTTKVDNAETRAIYNDQRGTTENKECSGRGLCDETSGLCQCFKGCTVDDCPGQSASMHAQCCGKSHTVHTHAILRLITATMEFGLNRLLSANVFRI